MSRSVDRAQAWRREFLTWSPEFFFPVAGVAALTGGAVMWVAVVGSRMLVGLLGVTIVAFAAWATTAYTAALWRTGGRRWRAAILVSLMVGLALVVTSELFRSAPLAYVALALFTIGVGPFVAAVTTGFVRHADLWVLAGLIVSGSSTLVMSAAWGSLPSPVRLVLLLAIGGGLAAYGFGLSNFPELSLGEARPPSNVFPGDGGRNALVVTTVGGVLVIVGAATGVAPIAGVGGWAMLVGLMAMSADPGRLDPGWFAERAIPLVGLIAIALGGYLMWTTEVAGRSLSFLLFVVAIVVVLGASVVWRNAIVVVAVIAGLVFVWGLVSFTTDDPAEVSSGSPGSPTAGVVAFGDSFISGEGAPRFYRDTDQRGDERNECRRAETAYPVLVSVEPTDDGGFAAVGADDGVETVDGLTTPGLDFYACSGAKAGQVIGFPADATERRAERDLPCEVPDERIGAQYPCGPDGVYGRALQIDNVPDDPGLRAGTELVILSIGGNDARFGDVVSGCLLPGSCAERREIWLDTVAALGPKLEQTYVEVKDAFGGSVPVVVMPYPMVLTEQTCSSSPLDASEHEFVFEFTTVLNQQIEAAAARAGVHFFEDGIFAFDGHRLCEDGERAINLIKLQPTDGPVTARMNPKSWTHNSMHPNPLGHRLTARALASWLNAHDILASGNPAPDEGASTELLDVLATRPFSIEPETVDQLSRQAPTESDCDFGAIGTFTTRVEVFDEQDDDGDRAVRVPIIGADPDAPICFTDSAGEWDRAERVEQPETPGESADVQADDAEADVRVAFEGGQVFLTGGRPNETCRARFDEERDDESLCDFQWVLFSSPVETGPGASADDENDARTWQLRAISYCSVDPSCPDTFSAWTRDQLDTASRKVSPLLAMIFLGGWSFAFGLALRRDAIRPRA